MAARKIGVLVGPVTRKKGVTNRTALDVDLGWSAIHRSLLGDGDRAGTLDTLEATAAGVLSHAAVAQPVKNLAVSRPVVLTLDKASITTEAILFDATCTEFTAFTTHSYHVARLPLGAELIVDNEDGVHGFRTDDVFRIQSYPEYDQTTSYSAANVTSTGNR